MSAGDAELEKLLRKLGTRRKRGRLSKAKLRKDTEAAMKRVAKSGISVSRACELAGVSRSSVYDEYDL